MDDKALERMIRLQKEADRVKTLVLFVTGFIFVVLLTLTIWANVQ